MKKTPKKKIFSNITIAVFLIMFLKCQSPESNFSLPEPNPASAEITLNSSGSTSKTIGPEGGSIEITGADSWNYKFTVPEGFLVSETEISMTPIASLTSPMFTEFTAGVQFEPDGLILPGIAWLDISGDVEGDNLIGLTYEGNGNEVAFSWAEITGSTIRIPITHFSGGGAGTPAPGGANRSPTNTMRAMGQALVNAFIENEENCIGFDHPLGGTVIEWYQKVFESMIEPKLKSAEENDLVLSEAISMVLEWKAWRKHAEYLLCTDITESLEAVPGEKTANELIQKGLVNAVDKAADFCATAHDLGETKHILAWFAASQLLFDIEDIDLTSQVDQRLRDCLSFELQFNSYVDLVETTLTFRADMKSTIKTLHPNAQGQTFGWFGEDDTPRAYGPLEYSPKLNYPSKPGCDVVISRIKTQMASAEIPELKISDPIRYVPINLNKPKDSETGIQGTQPPNDGASKDKNKFMLIFYPLEGSEYFEVTCTDLLGGPNEDGAWGPYTFNGIHEEDMNPYYNGFTIMLERGPGKLYGRATFDRTINVEVTITEKTTFDLFHIAPRVRK